MKIVIALTEHLGDIIACEPASRYVRYKYPDAHIAWVVKKRYRVLIDNNPYIDETITVDCLTDWIKMAHHDNFDLIVDLHVNHRVCSDCRVPLVKNTGHPFVSVYEFFDYGALLEAFSIGAGLPPLSAQPQVYLTGGALESLDSFGLPADYVVIHRKSNMAFKDWQDENWREIFSYIRNELGLAVVEVGVDCPTLDYEAINLIDASLPQTAAVMRGARMFIGVDSAPAHFANAARTPGVVLLGRYEAFRHYNPFTGFYAQLDPRVKLVRNPMGTVNDIPLSRVREAIACVHEAAFEPRREPAPAAAQALPPTDHDLRMVITQSGLFDSAWYRLHVPEAADLSADAALDHFIATMGSALDKPLPDFDCNWYLEQNPEVAAAEVHPLVHYLYTRERPRRHWKIYENGAEWIVGEDGDGGALAAPRMVGGNGIAAADTIVQPQTLTHFGQSFEGESIVRGVEDGCFPNETTGFPKVFAFYLPQFHPIEENDWAHGLGFTEWHNVAATKPMFAGHHQPRVPGELGFYDLRSKDVLDRQIQLAVEHGIDGFCFYYYYFAGKKLLYTPIKNYIESDNRAPFFFLWANENWTKRWDGGDRDVIIQQEHSDFDDKHFIRDLISTFRDERYLKIDGKPVLMIYKTHLFKNILETTYQWRDEILIHNFPGLYLVMVDDWPERRGHPRAYGFDASYEIPSNLTPREVEVANEQAPKIWDEEFDGRLIDYQKFATFHAGRPAPEHRRFRTVMAPWDNTPRYGSSAIIHINEQGDGYKNWLSQALLDTYRRFPPQERLVFIHSWNEWCEGTYIEPDARRGRRLLQDTREAVQTIRKAIDADRRQLAADADVSGLFQRVLAIKDEGALIVLKTARVETRHWWQELQRERAKPSREIAVVDPEPEVPNPIATPYARLLLERSIGNLITLEKLKYFLFSPLRGARRGQKDKIKQLRELRRKIRLG